MRVKPYDGRSAQELRADGYFVVSRKFGRVARIDVSPEEYREWTKKTCRTENVGALHLLHNLTRTAHDFITPALVDAVIDLATTEESAIHCNRGEGQ